MKCDNGQLVGICGIRLMASSGGIGVAPLYCDSFDIACRLVHDCIASIDGYDKKAFEMSTGPNQNSVPSHVIFGRLTVTEFWRQNIYKTIPYLVEAISRFDWNWWTDFVDALSTIYKWRPPGGHWAELRYSQLWYRGALIVPKFHIFLKKNPNKCHRRHVYQQYAVTLQ